MAETSQPVEVQLGFVEPFEDDSKNDAFVSKVGGRPIWLIPEKLPTPESLQCGVCRGPLSFFLQIYAPLEEFDYAYHRSLYVFCCKKGSCQKQDFSSSVKIIRAQLPSENKYYSKDEKKIYTNEDAKKFTQATLCCLCGKHANKHCAQCKKRDYCSSEHQAEHWKVFGHGKECSQLLEEKLQNMTISNDTDREILSKSSYIFPEYEIITDVEEEDMDPEEKQQEEEEMQEKIQSMIQTYEQEGDDDDKNDIEAEDTEVDKVFLNFQVVIKREPEQILRYARGAGSKPLWVNSKHILEEKDVPKCKYCGGERAYEFQILPQLLYKLKIEDRPDPMEWANLVAFTCKNSCSKPGTTYFEEVLYRQTD